MRKYYLTVLFAGLFAAVSSAQEGAETSRGVLNPNASRTVQTGDGVYLVYDGERNSLLPLEKRVYYVVPRIGYRTNESGTPDLNAVTYSKFSRVNIVLEMKYPDSREVIRGLRDINDRISPSNITQLHFSNLKAEHQLFQTFYAVPEGSESDLNLTGTELTISLTTYDGSREDVEKFVEAVKTGSELIQISGRVRFARSKLNAMNITWHDIGKSNAFRDFQQNADDKFVLAYQVGRLSMEVAREIRVDLWDEMGNDSSGFLDAVQTINDLLIANVKESYVDVNTLRDILSTYEIDLSSDAFQPTVLTKFAADVKNLSKSKWQQKYRHLVEESLETKDAGRKKAGGNFVFKAFGIGGGYERTWDKLSDRQQKELLDRNEYFYNEYDKSFKVEQEGKIIKRVDVRVYSNVPISIERQVDTRTTATKIEWHDDTWMPLNISTKKGENSKIDEALFRHRGD